MTKLRIFFYSIMLLSLASCATPMPQQQDIGPKPENYETRATEYIREKLKDPDSMKNIKVGAIRDGICRTGGLMFANRVVGPTMRGWVVPVSYNAKNSFGGYIGQTENYVWFQNNRLIGYSELSYACPIK